MELLGLLVLEARINEAEQNLDALIDAYSEYVTEAMGPSEVKQLPNGMNDAQKLEVASQRLEAAKRGIQLVNKLPPGPEKQQHKSRIFSNLNNINALIRDVTRALNNDGGQFGRSQMATQPVANVHTPNV